MTRGTNRKTLRTLAWAAALALTTSAFAPARAADEAKPAAPPAAAKVDDKAEGWTNLLEGGDLAKYWETTGNWVLKDGVVTLTPREGEKGWARWKSYLWLKEKQYKDFQVEFDYMVQKGGNSGFYFHVGNVDDPVAKGFEVQIYDSGSKKPDAKLTDHDSGGVIPGVPPTKNTAKPAGEWNRFSISVKDRKLTVVLNGETVNELDLTKVKGRPETGRIGFQDHAMPLSLRNIRVREL